MAYAIKDGWGFEIGLILKETPKKVVVQTRYMGGAPRESHWLRADIIAITNDEADAKKAAERMQSSKALLNDDQRKAEERHKQRIAQIAASLT